MNFDFKSFNWKEATSNESGQSSAALFCCFFMILALIFLTFTITVLLAINAFHKLEIPSLGEILAFITVNFAAAMTYLGVRLSSNNNLKINTTNTDKEA